LKLKYFNVSNLILEKHTCNLEGSSDQELINQYPIIHITHPYMRVEGYSMFLKVLEEIKEGGKEW
jgi:hypothetical protein